MALGLIGVVTMVQLLAPSCPEGGADVDHDGLTDECELSLAAAFAPHLVVSTSACNWDEPQQRLGGGYLFAVEPVDSVVRIAYLPAYLQDCGWGGLKCLIRLRGGCAPHAGDPEAIIVEVRRTDANTSANAWEAAAVFLSAHCFSRADGRCRWYDRSEFEWDGDRPFIWVAEGKNANYPSRDECDSGHWGYDTCDRNDARFRFPVPGARANVGSHAVPVCVGGDEVGSATRSPSAMECFWGTDAFGGWAEDAAATSYRTFLVQAAGFRGTD